MLNQVDLSQNGYKVKCGKKSTKQFKSYVHNCIKMAL